MCATNFQFITTSPNYLASTEVIAIAKEYMFIGFCKPFLSCQQFATHSIFVCWILRFVGIGFIILNELGVVILFVCFIQKKKNLFQFILPLVLTKLCREPRIHIVHLYKISNNKAFSLL